MKQLYILMACFVLIGSLFAADQWTLDGNRVYWQQNGYGISCTPATSVSSLPAGIEAPHTQFCNFTSSNPTPIMANLSFVFDSTPTAGGIHLWQNISHPYQQNIYGRVNKSVTVPNVSNYVPVTLNSSSQCYIGDLNNTYFYNITYTINGTNTSTNVGCFNSYTQNGNAFTLYYQENGVVGTQTIQNHYFDWADINSLFTSELIAGHRVYTVNDVAFTQGTNYYAKFDYTVAGSGKFDIVAHSGSPSMVVAGTAPIYVWLDPWYTGGTITSDGNYSIHTFTSNGTFTIPKNVNATILIIGGGGGGGRDIYSGVRAAGGGGAGGLLYIPIQNISAGNYTVTIGNGGAGGINSDSVAVNGLRGENSSFLNYTAVGGGAGGGHAQNAPYTWDDRKDGGSGGGTAGNGIVGGSGVAGQGYYGGNGSSAPPYTGGGGGGGSNGTGGNTDNTNAGIGGAGSFYSISGASTYYAWGANGTGGSGAVTGTAGAANTGAGGGGSRGANGGAGGSGVVIIRYLTADATGSLTVNYTIGGTATGNNTTFTPPANLTINATADPNYYFTGWTVESGTCTVLNASNPNTQAEVVDATPCTVQANFGRYGNLTVNYTTGGTATGNNSTFIPPANLSINATASVGYYFVNWTTNCNGTGFGNASNANTYVNVNDTTSCFAQANFGRYGNLTVNYSSGGTATGNNSTFTPPANLTITASVSAGYHFVNWTTNCNGTISSPTSLNTVILVNDATSCFAQANFLNSAPNSVIATTTNSTGGSTYYKGSILGYLLAVDRETTPLTYYFTWYTNGIANGTGSGSIANNTNTLINTVSGTLRGQTWQLSTSVYDGVNNVTNASANVTIQDSPPTAPSLLSPSNGEILYTVNQSNITLSWSASTDIDNDTVMYTYCVNATCANTTGIFAIVLLNASSTYTWNVSASDGNLTANSTTWTFRIEQIVPPIMSAISVTPNPTIFNQPAYCSVTAISDSNMTAYWYFYVNFLLTESGSSAILNNTPTNVGTLGSGNFSYGDTLLCQAFVYNQINSANMSSSISYVTGASNRIPVLPITTLVYNFFQVWGWIFFSILAMAVGYLSVRQISSAFFVASGLMIAVAFTFGGSLTFIVAIIYLVAGVITRFSGQ